MKGFRSRYPTEIPDNLLSNDAAKMLLLCVRAKLQMRNGRCGMAMPQNDISNGIGLEFNFGPLMRRNRVELPSKQRQLFHEDDMWLSNRERVLEAERNVFEVCIQYLSSLFRS